MANQDLSSRAQTKTPYCSQTSCSEISMSSRFTVDTMSPAWAMIHHRPPPLLYKAHSSGLTNWPRHLYQPLFSIDTGPCVVASGENALGLGIHSIAFQRTYSRKETTGKSTILKSGLWSLGTNRKAADSNREIKSCWSHAQNTKGVDEPFPTMQSKKYIFKNTRNKINKNGAIYRESQYQINMQGYEVF